MVALVTGLEEEHASAPRFGPDGTLFYIASGAVCRISDDRPDPVPVLPASVSAGRQPPAVSRDGKFLAVVVRKGSGRRLHIVSAHGVRERVLPGNVDVLGTAAWSPEGDWIAIGGNDESGPGLFKFPVDGGPPERIVDGHALNPIWSPTDDLILYAGPQVMGFIHILGVRSNGDPVDLPKMKIVRLDERMRFLPDGSGLIYMQGLRASQDFWLQDLENVGDPANMAEKRRLTRLEGIASTHTMRTFDIDPRGEFIVFDQLVLNSDIVMWDLEKDED